MDGIGRFFTPPVWAEWLVEEFGVFQAWTDGASICDPTAGPGSFAIALFSMARKRGIEVTYEMVRRLTLVETHERDLEQFARRARSEFDIDFPSENLHARDVLLDTPGEKFDVLVGNPPWANFADLPEDYKDRIRPLFVEKGLVPDSRKALLGSSRVDIAALVLNAAMGEMTVPGGRGVFFLPASLFTGGDAHRGFRRLETMGRKMHVEKVYRFTESRIFGNVSTSCVAAGIVMDRQQSFPVEFFVEEGGGWIRKYAFPLSNPDDQWRVVGNPSDGDGVPNIRISIQPHQQPRQGINTCGANAVFMFEELPSDLPEEYLYPLATREQWRNDPHPAKWVLLPYDSSTGKPLKPQEVRRVESLHKYLTRFRKALENRKGKLIGAQIKRGLWWAFLGVGEYSFAPYKVIWQAYGTDEFDPIILGSFQGKVWQPNQAMHAFIPCWSLEDASRIRGALLDSGIVSLLREMGGEGKRNWAQPGKIKKILSLQH